MNHRNRNVRKRTFWQMCPLKTQILRPAKNCIRAVWSDSSLRAYIRRYIFWRCGPWTLNFNNSRSGRRTNTDAGGTAETLPVISYSEPSLQRQHLFPKTLPLKWICYCTEYFMSGLIFKKGLVLFLFPHRTIFLNICLLTNSKTHVSLNY